MDYFASRELFIIKGNVGNKLNKLYVTRKNKNIWVRIYQEWR